VLVESAVTGELLPLAETPVPTPNIQGPLFEQSVGAENANNPLFDLPHIFLCFDKFVWSLSWQTIVFHRYLSTLALLLFKNTT
jgi:hypothetical protein